MRQTEGDRRAIAQAKLEDPLSIGSYQNAQEVMDHWDWYLSCLCSTQQELEVMRMPWELPLIMLANNMTTCALHALIRELPAVNFFACQR